MSYCGNNKFKSGRRGSRYECFKRGVGIGRNTLSLNTLKDGKYEPIVNRKWYCGNKRRAPRGYGGLGSNSECLQLGFGVGQQLGKWRNYWFYNVLFFVLLFVLTFLILWMRKTYSTIQMFGFSLGISLLIIFGLNLLFWII